MVRTVILIPIVRHAWCAALRARSTTARSTSCAPPLHLKPWRARAHRVNVKRRAHPPAPRGTEHAMQSSRLHLSYLYISHLRKWIERMHDTRRRGKEWHVDGRGREILFSNSIYDFICQSYHAGTTSPARPERKKRASRSSSWCVLHASLPIIPCMLLCAQPHVSCR